jgi:hypothetical protein
MPWLEAAAAETGGTHTAQDVLDACARGACALWVGRDCFAVTEFLTYPRLRVLNVFLAGGARGAAMAEHTNLQPGIEAYARAGGASRITFMGRLSAAARRRNGWTAGCPDFRHSHGFYFKDLIP